MNTVKRIVFAATATIGLGSGDDKGLTCPHCHSTHIRTHNSWLSQPRYFCQNCDRDFVEPEAVQQFHNAVKEHCLKLYREGKSVSQIQRATGVARNLISHWVQLSVATLPHAPQLRVLQKNAQIDDFQNFVRARNRRLRSQPSARKASRVF